MTNRPFFDWKVATKFKKVDDGYEVKYRTERIYIYGMPEVETLSQRDLVAYLSAISEPEDNEEQKTASELEAIVRKINAEG